jgi:outer membrane protein assembly factor BamA
LQDQNLSALNARLQSQGIDTAALDALLLPPQGTSIVFAQRAALTWDRRDNPFDAHKGTFVVTSAELVNSYPISGALCPTAAPCDLPTSEGHFVRLQQTFAGYIPITRSITFAAEIRLGQNIQISKGSETYPDRLFFLGGPDSMRGWRLNSLVPQEFRDQIQSGAITIADVPVRGGNFMVNPRAELRFPIKDPIESVFFAEFGNVWKDPTYILHHGLVLRTDIGTGLRIKTPIGPLAFDVGFNVDRQSYEDIGAFNFAIGLF